VGKEQIAGLVAALKRFTATEDEVRRSAWMETVEDLAAGLEGIPGTRVTVTGGRIPMLHLMLTDVDLPSGVELAASLTQGDPSVHVNTSRIYDDVLVFNPLCLLEGDVGKISARVRAELEP
jgi:hypothetical protein